MNIKKLNLIKNKQFQPKNGQINFKNQNIVISDKNHKNLDANL